MPLFSSIRRGLLLSTLLLLGCSPVANAYVSPTTGTTYPVGVVRAFDKPAKNWLSGHRGVDLKLEIGATVVAAEHGTVSFVGNVAGMPVISIEHADGVKTTYQPVHPSVRKGETVEEGQAIGFLGHHPHGDEGLHWGALIGKDDYINPLSLLNSPAIRLKPVAS